MDPREFHNLAESLVRNSRPAEIRTSISRAYYGALNVGVHILNDLGFIVSRGTEAYGQVRRFLQNSRDVDVKTAASMLGDLHGRRIQADYELYRTDIENSTTAEGLVKDAGDIIRAFDECLEEPKRSKIVAAIKDYQSKINR